MYGVTSLIVSAILFPLLGVAAVALRFYVRLRVKRTFIGLDDWMITFSCLLVCASGPAQVVGKIKLVGAEKIGRLFVHIMEIIAATLGELGREKDPMNSHRTYIESKVCHMYIPFSL